mmetsp:Transcript_42437/g.135993  ORF Transcript_42437/g.135993 Transcript_42437/m.135993 type:complete len:1403 (-) Transcript_42437:4252-8460(-)
MAASPGANKVAPGPNEEAPVAVHALGPSGGSFKQNLRRFSISSTGYREGGPVAFTFKNFHVRQSKDAKVATFTVVRLGGGGSQSVEYQTEPHSAEEGRDFDSSRGVLVFKDHDNEKQVEVILMDNEEATIFRNFDLVLHNSSIALHNADGEEVQEIHAKCTILSSRHQAAVAVLFHPFFQGLVGFCTLWALFANDLAIIFAPASSDETVGWITLVVLIMLALEICLTAVVKQRKYLTSIMFIMDLIAVIALLPSVPIIYRQLGRSTTAVLARGSIARAARAARAGSRAGRMMKLPRLFMSAKVGKNKARVIEKVLRASETLETLDADVRGRSPSPHAEAAATAIEDTLEANEEAISNVAKGVMSTPANIGMQVMESFTGKVIVMMMLILIIATNLFTPPPAKQKDMGLAALGEILDASGGDVQAEPFRRMLAVYVAGGGGDGSEYNDRERLVYLKVNGQIISRLAPETAQYAAPPALYDDGGVYNKARELEINRVGDCDGGCTVGDGCVARYLEDACTSAALFDNRKNIQNESRSSIILTVSIVIILAVGMALIAGDLQAFILDPMDKVVKLVKELASVMRSDEGSRDEISLPANATTAERWVHAKRKAVRVVEKIQKLFPSTAPLRVVSEVLKNVEKTFGVRLPKAHNKINMTEKGLKQRLAAFYEVFHRARTGDITLEEMRAELRTMLGVLDASLLGEDEKDIEYQTYVLAMGLFAPPANLAWDLLVEVIAAMARSAGVAVGASGDVTIKQAATGTRYSVSVGVTWLIRALGETCPPGMAEMSMEQLINTGEAGMKAVLERQASRLGVQLTQSDLAGSMFDVARRIEPIFTTQLLARLPQDVRKHLPSDLLLSKSVRSFKEAAENAVKTRCHEVLVEHGASIAPDPSGIQTKSLKSYLVFATLLAISKLFVPGSSMRLLSDAADALRSLKKIPRPSFGGGPTAGATSAAVREWVANNAIMWQELKDYLAATFPDIPNLPKPEAVAEDADSAIKKAKAIIWEAVLRGTALISTAVARVEELSHALPTAGALRDMSSKDVEELQARLAQPGGAFEDAVRGIQAQMAFIDTTNLALPAAARRVIEVDMGILHTLNAEDFKEKLVPLAEWLEGAHKVLAGIPTRVFSLYRDVSGRIPAGVLGMMTEGAPVDVVLDLVRKYARALFASIGIPAPDNLDTIDVAALARALAGAAASIVQDVMRDSKLQGVGGQTAPFPFLKMLSLDAGSSSAADLDLKSHIGQGVQEVVETRASAAAEWSRHEIETLAKKCHVALAGAAIAGAARAGAAVDGIDAVESLDAIGAKLLAALDAAGAIAAGAQQGVAEISRHSPELIAGRRSSSAAAVAAMVNRSTTLVAAPRLEDAALSLPLIVVTSDHDVFRLARKIVSSPLDALAHIRGVFTHPE